MSSRAENRKRALELLREQTHFGVTPVSRAKLVQCLREYWVVDLHLRNELTSAPMKIRCAFNYHGDYVGEASNVRYLAERGIMPKAMEGKTVCTFGRSHKDGKWYGWSHRAIAGFGIGDTVQDGDCASETLPVGMVAKSEEDCRQMAMAYANSVG